MSSASLPSLLLPARRTGGDRLDALTGPGFSSILIDCACRDPENHMMSGRGDRGPAARNAVDALRKMGLVSLAPCDG